jgi:hypothetical protein
MAVSISSAPTDAFTGPRPAGQKLIYTLEESGTAPERYVVQVFEGDSLTADGTEIARLYLTPNANDVVHFDLSDIAEGRVNAPNTSDEPGIIHGVTSLDNPENDGLRKYTIKAGKFDSGTLTLNEDSSVIYLIGGAEQISSGKDTSFADYYPTGRTKKVWLTDRPVGHTTTGVIRAYMAEDDQAVGIVLNTLFTLPTPTLNKFNVKLYDIDDTLLGEVTNSAIVGFDPLFDALNIHPLAPSNVRTLMGSQWDSAWHYYTIQPQNAASAAAGKTYEVWKDCRSYKNDAVQLAWTNTRGGWDYLRLFDRGKTAYHVTGTETYELRNRSFDIEERELLQYAFRSKNVMYRVGTGGRWLPCTINTNSYVVQPASAQLFDVSFQIELAQDIRC